MPYLRGGDLVEDGHLHPGRDGEPAILATVDIPVEFREGPNILSVRARRGYACTTRSRSGPPTHRQKSGTPAPSPPPLASPSARGLAMAAGAAHIVAVLQGDAVGSVGSQRAL